MCGIAGLLGAGRGIESAWVEAMTDRIRHRGPDDGGVWCDTAAQVALGHRRLAIVDLSSAGRQPMLSADERWVLVYNGEVYNHEDLRRELEGAGQAPNWRGRSDTETLLAAIAAWGLTKALQRAHGMWALALWDRTERRLFLARDRFGEKPLYYGTVAGRLAFASELKALRTLPGFDNAVDPAALRALLERGYVPPSGSIYLGIEQVPAGCWVELDSAGATCKVERYYDYGAVVRSGAQNAFNDATEAREALRDALGQAIARQLVADVPVGTLLSGGIDSSLITALAARHASAPVHSYSIGFRDAGFDEAPHARRVAEHLGTVHNELYLDANDALATIPRLSEIWDEPFGDSSQIPTFLVSRFARQHVTVALTGDGGDELFAGYRRHLAFPALARALHRVPTPIRQLLLGIGGAVPARTWNAVGGLRPGGAPSPFFGDKLRRGLGAARAGSGLDELYGNFLDQWHGLPSPLTVEANGPETPFPANGSLPAEARVMLADALGYLPGDILTKVDRAAMAVSLEGRIPFLDSAVAQVAARIPIGMKVRAGKGKVVLREMLHELVPAELVERPKAGFAIPVGEWLRGPLRDWAEDLLAPSALADSGLLAPAPIRARWQAHLARRVDASEALWSVLAFQAWRRVPAG